MQENQNKILNNSDNPFSGLINWIIKSRSLIVVGVILLVLFKGNFKNVNRFIGIGESIEKDCVSIEAGMTVEQVENILGKPTMMDSKNKVEKEDVMWIYHEMFFMKNCSVIFDEGKVFSSNWNDVM